MENGKAPAVTASDEMASHRKGYGHAHAHAHVTGAPSTSTHEPIVTVQPPRREDLQPSYAQVLVDDDGTKHGWYGAMSELLISPPGNLGFMELGDWNKSDEVVGSG